MFLKSLTLRGFKSFADKTVLDFEPGITVIVGPNGSGKSNIVDALSWVLGTHSAKSLRGAAMADVIFAGARERPALGRASVEITIDNSSGLLPIEFSEVTIARAMFASGENEYSINNVACRALDVQELLSDTGLGRENHTIVGQGQLDAILNARPEDRRTFIEEAAGILKHRRRKERALRKLTQMDGHVERLTDVLRELRRNLRPLQRQAEAAERHAELQARLREIRIVRALRDLDALQIRFADEEEAFRRVTAELDELESGLAEQRAAERAIEDSLASLGPRARAAAETHFRLAGLAERFRGLIDRIEERRAGLIEAVEEPIAGRDPEQLLADAAAERTGAGEIDGQRAVVRETLEVAEAARERADQARRAHEQAAAAESRRRAEARERRLRWEGQVAALRSTLSQAASEEGRLASQVSGVNARRDALVADIGGVQADIQRLDAGTGPLGQQLDAAEAVLAKRQAALDEAARRERELERRRASLEARADALRSASAEATEGTAALLAAAEAGHIEGVLGPLADHVTVDPRMARAVAAALGPLGDALVVASPESAASALRFVRVHKSGRVLLLVGQPSDETPAPVDLNDLGARPLAEALSADETLQNALRSALVGVYLVGELASATDLAVRYPGFVFVSSDGEVAGPRGWSGGSAAATSAVLSRAAAEQAEQQLAQVNDELLRAHRQLGDADRELTVARREYEAATAALQESDSLITSAAERLKRLRGEVAACDAELEMLTGQQADLASEIEGQRLRLAELERRGPEAAPDDEPEGPDLEAERLDDELAAAREAEVQARLAVSALDQRLEEVHRRITDLEREADDVRRQLAEREERKRWRLAAIARCSDLTSAADTALQRAEESLGLAAVTRDSCDEAVADQQRQLGALRASLRERQEAVTALREAGHHQELGRSELRHAVEAVEVRLRELGLDPAAALAEARNTGDSGPLAGDDERDESLAVDEETLIRKIGLLGAINPLALEEFHQLQERQEFLTEQLADLKQSKADLLNVVEAVDNRIREVFAAAYADVAAQFERLFPSLFPGGEGRLVLTDPDDMLHSGVDVEARPPGKRVKRLSLLSGGERSLTALAVLFAIFAARPSPFYVLDEVEAALDDVNLQRLLGVLSEFQSSSQLLVITHQKRTMEVADTLYGVSMNSAGCSKVVSQRLREPVAG